MRKQQTHGPDFTHGGEFVDWGGEGSTIDEHFPPLIDVAGRNIATDVELVRWSPDDPAAPQIARWWAKQGHAIRRYVGPKPGIKVTTRSRVHTDLGVKIGYVRFNRTRLAVLPESTAAAS